MCDSILCWLRSHWLKSAVANRILLNTASTCPGSQDCMRTPHGSGGEIFVGGAGQDHHAGGWPATPGTCPSVPASHAVAIKACPGTGRHVLYMIKKMGTVVFPVQSCVLAFCNVRALACVCPRSQVCSCMRSCAIGTRTGARTPLACMHACFAFDHGRALSVLLPLSGPKLQLCTWPLFN